MKQGNPKTMLLLLLLFFPALSFATGFRPNTVQEMDAEILLTATGRFEGEISQNDSAQIRMITFKDSQAQKVLSADEKLFIGEKILEPKYAFEGENKIAVFEISNLQEFAADTQFIVQLQARIRTSAKMELDKKTVQAFNGNEFLQPTKFIESDDQELQSKAALEFSATDEIGLVREIALWVNSNTKYDFENYYNAVWSAKQTYESGRGVCDEFANLTAAFTRIKKLPTRYVSGISFDGQRFGNHGWLEVFIKEYGWTGVDSTYLEAGYIDGAHFALSTSDDPDTAANLKIITKSKKPLNVTSSLQLPQVKINDIKFFEGTTQARIIKPGNVGSKEEFEINAVIKNNQNSNILLPLQLAVHEDFFVQSPNRLEMFQPFEEKTVSWKTTAPQKEDTGYYYKYGLAFFSPDQNISDTIGVFPEKKTGRTQANITATDISPYITESGLRVDVTLSNSGAREGTATISAKNGAEILAQQEQAIQSGETKKVSLQINKKGLREITLSIVSDNAREVKIVFPEKKDEKPAVIEQPTVPEQQQTPKQDFSLIITAALVALIAVLLGLNIALQRHR